MEIPRERGLVKAKLLEAMYENILEFPGVRGDGGCKTKSLLEFLGVRGGGGLQNKKPSLRGVWILSGTALCTLFNFAKFHLAALLQCLCCFVIYSMGAPVMVELEGQTDPLQIAMKELK